jgi:hypothetical protein
MFDWLQLPLEYNSVVGFSLVWLHQEAACLVSSLRICYNPLACLDG